MNIDTWTVASTDLRERGAGKVLIYGWSIKAHCKCGKSMDTYTERGRQGVHPRMAHRWVSNQVVKLTLMVHG